MNEELVNKCIAIGSGAKYISPQLDLNTLEINKEQAEEFGLTLLAYASKIDVRVGNLESYGYNAVIIGNEVSPVLTQYPGNVSIDRLLYDFDV